MDSRFEMSVITTFSIMPFVYTKHAPSLSEPRDLTQRTWKLKKNLQTYR